MESKFPFLPPHLDAARAQLEDLFRLAERREIDLLNAPWTDIERSVIKVLMGPFHPDDPKHQQVALGLAAVLGARLSIEHQAFWFPNRDDPEGMALGFPQALIVLSPIGAVVDALRHAKLERLNDISQGLRRTLAQAKFSLDAAPQRPQRLTAEDYQRLFDPSLMQFVTWNMEKVDAAWQSTPEKLTVELRDALGRAGRLPPETRQALEGQLVEVLKGLEPGKALIEQAERSTQVAELMAHLFGTSEETGFAPEEFWQEVVFPLLFIGHPASFPPVDAQELEMFKAGTDALALFVEVVPYQVSAPEEGILGVFPLETVEPPHPAFAAVPQLRLLKVTLDALRPQLESFDRTKAVDTVSRFRAYLEEKAGAAPKTTPAGSALLEPAIALIEQLKTCAAAAKDQPRRQVCLRRVTEVEASSEGALALVRTALSAPRIILA